MRDARFVTALAYIALQIVTGLAAAWAGYEGVLLVRVGGR